MMDANHEMTLGDIFEQIAGRLAEARTHALMGERETALGMMHAAVLEYQRFREVLKECPGYHALEYSFDVTMSQLCAEQSRSEENEADTALKPQRKARRKAVRAA